MCIPELSSCLVPGCRSAARVLAVLGVGTGMLAGAAPTDAQTPAPTRFTVEAVRHVDGGDAEVDLTWLHPTRLGATGFTVRYDLNRTDPHPGCASTPTGPQMDSGTAGGGDRRITIRGLNRETSACFWIQADFNGAQSSDWTLVEPSPIDLRDETPIGTIPTPTRPPVKPGDGRITVTFRHPGTPPACDACAADGTVTRWAHAQWFYARRLERGTVRGRSHGHSRGGGPQGNRSPRRQPVEGVRTT